MARRKGRIGLFIFVDALGWTTVERTQFLPELQGVRQSVRTIVGYSSGAVPSILTGVPPAQHGQWSFFYWDPEGSPFRWLSPLRALPHRLAANHRVRGPLSKIVGKLHGYTGYFNLYAAPFDRLAQWNYCEKRDLFAPGGLNGYPTAFDAWRWAGIPFHVSDWRLPEDHNLDRAVAAVADPSLEAAFVYLPGFDAWQHEHGPKNAPDGVGRYAEAVRRIVKSAQSSHDEVGTFVFSDHGMADVWDNADLGAAVEGTGLKYGRDYAAVYDSTMVRLWYLDPASRPTLEAALLGTGKGRFLGEDDMAEMGILFEDKRYGEAIFLCDPGVLIVPSDMGLGTIAGMHGYTDLDPASDAVLLGSHPSPVPVERIDDLNHLMRAWFGLPPVAGSAAQRRAAA